MQSVGGFNPQHLSESRGFDGKRVRKAIQRRTIDYNSTILRQLEMRLICKTPRDFLAIQPESSFIINYLPATALNHNPASSITTKFIHTSTNKVRCPINAIAWTPEGRRLITGASSGEFTLWNGLTFNFETILQAHDTAIRCMKWSHNDNWMISGEDSGIIKYWQSNMNNLKIVHAHKETVRDLTFSPTDTKFASCSDDGTIKIWSFADSLEERVLTGHGWDVKCLAWHPTKGILASGSKDNLAKIWDPKSGKSLATLHGHKNTIMQTCWNKNGNWLLTACRDQLVRLYDIRTMKEVEVFRGHKREVQSIAWHPVHEKLFVSGGWEGSMHFWMTGGHQPIASMEAAHESSVFALDWHPLGHILVSGSNDHTTRFWTRNRPGEPMNDRYNLSKEEADSIGLHAEETPEEITDTSAILPGLGGFGNDGLPGLGSGLLKPTSGYDHKKTMRNPSPQRSPPNRRFERGDQFDSRNARGNFERDDATDSRNGYQRGRGTGNRNQSNQHQQRGGYQRDVGNNYQRGGGNSYGNQRDDSNGYQRRDDLSGSQQRNYNPMGQRGNSRGGYQQSNNSNNYQGNRY